MSRVTSEEASDYYPRTKPFGGAWKRLLLRLEGYEIMGDITPGRYGVDLLKNPAPRTVRRLKERHTGISLSFPCGLFGYARQA